MPRKEKQIETLKARETIYTTASEQSTENREPHTIRATHPPPPTRQASKQTEKSRRDGEEIGKKGKRQSWGIGSSHPPPSPSFLIISPEHQADRPRRGIPEPPAIIRPASLPVPLVDERGETIRQASNTPTPDNAEPPPSAPYHPTAPERQPEQARDATHRRRPLRQASKTRRQTSPPPRSP